MRLLLHFFFFFNDTATTEIYTLSLHDALPISRDRPPGRYRVRIRSRAVARSSAQWRRASRGGNETDLCPEIASKDRKSTRLNSSHDQISYAVFCLKKKKYISLPPELPIVKVKR